VVYTPAEGGRSRLSAKTSRSERHSPTFGTSFFATRMGRPQGAAKELHDLLESLRVSVWFSEKDVLLGAPVCSENR